MFVRNATGAAVMVAGFVAGVLDTRPAGATVGAVEPCPARFEAPEVPSGGDQSARLAEATRLEPMLGTVLAYGIAHPDTFAGYGLAWHTVDDASVFIALSGDAEAAEADLLLQVPYPDELIVCQAMFSDVDSATLREQVEERVDGHRFISLGEATDGVIEVVLDVTEDALAVELVQTFGGRVRVSVGWFPYPLPDPLPPSVCELRPFDPVTIPELEVTIDLVGVSLDPDISRRSYEVRIRNTGNERIDLSSGAGVGWLIDPSTGQTVGSFFGVIPAIGYPIDLEPGDETTIPLLVGVTSCDPELGYTVPTGRYELVAAVPIFGTVSGDLMSEPVSIDVVTDS